jgi:hypothetical protein
LRKKELHRGREAGEREKIREKRKKWGPAGVGFPMQIFF